MGTKLKVLSVVIGLMLIPLNLWPLSVVLFIYALSGLFLGAFRRRGSQRSEEDDEVSANTAPVRQGTKFKGRRGSSVRLAVGFGMLLLALTALAQHGTYSPFVFGVIGVVALIWKAPFARLGNIGTLHPVEESILLKRSIDPIHWFAVAEVKLATKQVGRALGGVGETLIVTSGDKPSILVVLRATSLTLKEADESLVARLRELARVSAPLGAYILPLDSGEAVDALARLSVEPVELEAKGWPYPLSVTDYNVLSMEVERGFVHSVGAYRTTIIADGEKKAEFPPMRQVFSRPPLLWEVFQEMGKKVSWPSPDTCTSFLASVFATRGETIGERVVEANVAENPSQVLVQSLGTAPVQISRVQLRAIARVYA